jgi:hypothetical protein
MFQFANPEHPVWAITATIQILDVPVSKSDVLIFYWLVSNG